MLSHRFIVLARTTGLSRLPDSKPSTPRSHFPTLRSMGYLAEVREEMAQEVEKTVDL